MLAKVGVPEGVAAFDPSTTKFGVAFGTERDGKPRTIVWQLPGADELVFDRTLGIVLDSVTSLLSVANVKLVAIEAPIIVAARSAHTMVALMQLAGVVRAASHKAGARVHMVASSTVRKHFVNHGRPDDPKRAVMERCRVLGWDVANNDAADAAATWSWLMSKSFPRWSPKSTPLFAEKVGA